jgi:O-antigen/teichoic acid export membrane protein
MALFPMVAERKAKGERSGHLLLQAVTLTAILCCAAATIYFVGGEWLVGLLYGDRYRPAGQVLRYFGFAMFPMAIVLVAEHFMIAKGRILFTYLFVVAAPVEIGAIALFHQDLRLVVAIVGATGVALIAMACALLRKDLFEGER